MIPFIHNAALFMIGFVLARVFREYPEIRKPIAVVAVCLLVHLMTLTP